METCRVHLCTFWNTCFVSGSICHNVLEYIFNRKTWFSAKHKYVMGDIALIFTLDMKSSTFYISFKPGRIKPWFKLVQPESLKGLRNGWPFRKKDMHIREWNNKVLGKSAIKKGGHFSTTDPSRWHVFYVFPEVKFLKKKASCAAALGVITLFF